MKIKIELQFSCSQSHNDICATSVPNEMRLSQLFLRIRIVNAINRIRDGFLWLRWTRASWRAPSPSARLGLYSFKVNYSIYSTHSWIVYSFPFASVIFSSRIEINWSLTNFSGMHADFKGEHWVFSAGDCSKQQILYPNAKQLNWAYNISLESSNYIQLMS